MLIRIACAKDAEALLQIYAQYIDTNITFEYELPTVAQFRKRIVDTLTMYPYLVAQEEGRICGYAYAHRIQQREAYQWGAELSIYLDREVQRCGVGTQLYLRLITELKRQGVRSVYGCVATPNPGSERLHEKLGFKRIALFRKAGFKNHAWHDITWFEKEIAEHDCDPAPLIPFAASDC